MFWAKTIKMMKEDYRVLSHNLEQVRMALNEHASGIMTIVTTPEELRILASIRATAFSEDMPNVKKPTACKSCTGGVGGGDKKTTKKTTTTTKTTTTKKK